MKVIDGNYADSREFDLGDNMSAVFFRGSVVLMDNAGVMKETFVLTREQFEKLAKIKGGSL